MTVLDSSIPILHYFEEISQIPRGSYNEKGIADYIEQVAKEYHLAYKRDAMHNLIVYKDASKGYEEHPSIMLQAHIDMVNEKNNNSNHDFEKDPLDLYVEDGFLHARGTTLGVDDGYGVCYMLALLTSNEYKHPALECVFTVQEEIGLCGAMGFDENLIHARKMIGLDSAEEGETCTTSSGGSDVYIKKNITFTSQSDPVYCLEIKGLLGGHSGECINLERGNANKIAGRILYYLKKDQIDISICNITGGLKNNAIPRECVVTFASKSDYNLIQEKVTLYANDIKNELKESDSGLEISIIRSKADKTISKKESDDIISILYLGINGMISKSMSIPGLTTVSLNMGVVTTSENQIIINYSLRSPIASARNEMANQLSFVAELFDATVEVANDYPGWDYDPNSKLRVAYKEFFDQYSDTTLKESATHGGLETGIWKGKIPDLDIITMGPDMADIHTPDERLNIKSYLDTFDLLVAFIKTL